MSSVLTSKKATVISVVVFIVLLMQMEAFARNNWERITQLPTERERFATAVVDNKIYLIGGTLSENRKKIPPGPVGLSTVEVYDTQTNTWQRGVNMPTLRHAAKAAVVNGIIYVFGGYSAKDQKVVNMKFPTAVEAYDPQNDTWSRKQNMPVPRIHFGLGVVAGKVHIVGGKTDIRGGPTDRVDIYDPATDTWTTAPQMPVQRNLDFDSVAVANNRIYVIGGIPPIIEEYNPISRQWQKMIDMLDLRRGFSQVVMKDNIYLIGGFTPTGRRPKYLATVDVYNPQTQAWSDIRSMPTAIRPYGAAAVNGKIYVLGGYGKDFEFNPDVLVYDTGFRAVEALGKLPVRWSELKAEPQH